MKQAVINRLFFCDLNNRNFWCIINVGIHLLLKRGKQNGKTFKDAVKMFACFIVERILITTCK